MNQRHVIICLFLASTFNIEGVAQNSTTITTNYINLQIKEGNLSNIIFKSSGIGLSLRKSTSTPHRISSINLNFSMSRPRASIEVKQNSLYTFINLGYEHLKRVKIKNGKLLIGGELSASYRTAFYNNFDQSRFYWTSFIGSHAVLNHNRPLSDNFELISCISMPVTGLLSRPATIRFTKADKQNLGNLLQQTHSHLTFALPYQYFNPILEFGVKYNNTKQRSLGLHYFFEYLSAKAKHSESYQEVQHTLGLQLTF